MKRRTVRGVRVASAHGVIWADFRDLRYQVLRRRRNGDLKRPEASGECLDGPPGKPPSGSREAPCTK